MNWKDCELLITGGTGSLGKALVKRLYKKVRGIRVYSRDELKQWEMRRWLKKNGGHADISFLIGDVRNRERLIMAMQGVHYVIHTAAMKQVPACEYNPWEAVSTNINGAWNVIHAAIQSHSVRQVMNISTDKAVYPINLYGHTKATAEKLFIHSNVYSRGGGYPYFSCCRYGNVIGSRGSILPLFLEQAHTTGKITVTHPGMTRFWISLEDVVSFVLSRMEEMTGGEIYVPKMPSVRVMDIAEIISDRFTGAAFAIPQAKIETIGIRPGEKIHESLITKEEWGETYDNLTYFTIKKIQNKDTFLHQKNFKKEFKQIHDTYTSDDNDTFLSKDEIARIIANYLGGL